LNAANPAESGGLLSSLYTFHHEHDPDGTGKFYMGREIALVMGHQAADWLERPERNAEEHSNDLVDQLQVAPGQQVADIGAGTGFFSRRLGEAVGPSGRVFAVDIQPEMLTLLTNLATKAGITNITPVLGSARDPKLPSGAIDVVLMVDVYHEFAYPYEMMTNICRAVKTGGRVVFVEYRGEDPKVPIKPVHKMTEPQLKKEMTVQPLTWIKTIESLPRQRIVEFKKR
jgi:ubiquinone/menaquinone biosynthesis C-methylase UbiE